MKLLEFFGPISSNPFMSDWRQVCIHFLYAECNIFPRNMFGSFDVMQLSESSAVLKSLMIDWIFMAILRYLWVSKLIVWFIWINPTRTGCIEQQRLFISLMRQFVWNFKGDRKKSDDFHHVCPYTHELDLSSMNSKWLVALRSFFPVHEKIRIKEFFDSTAIVMDVFFCLNCPRAIRFKANFANIYQWRFAKICWTCHSIYNCEIVFCLHSLGISTVKVTKNKLIPLGTIQNSTVDSVV